MHTDDSRVVVVGVRDFLLVGWCGRSLEVSNNRLAGTIPASIGNLTSLTNLRLFQNSLVGTIPSTISRLTNLK
jgi:hypothetical protein